MRFSLFANVKLVKGFKNSLLIDLQKSRYRSINNKLYILLSSLEDNEMESVHYKYESVFTYKEFTEYVNETFVCDGWGFFDRDNELFTELDESFIVPYDITNLIVDFGKISNIYYFNLFKEINYLNVESLCLRFFDDFYLASLDDYLSILNLSTISHIELYVPYTFDNEINLILLSEKYLRINTVVFFNSPHLFEIKYTDLITIYYLNYNLKDEKCCGVINQNYFSLNIKTFTEAKNYNSCLNKKVSVDMNGNIKNCPSISENFGNINNVTLLQAIKNEDLIKYWSITKDAVFKCKDCEFRYVCTDCRAYLEIPQDKYSAPLKCGYDPYSGVWDEWSKNPFKQNAIQYYGMEELVVKK